MYNSFFCLLLRLCVYISRHVFSDEAWCISLTLPNGVLSNRSYCSIRSFLYVLLLLFFLTQYSSLFVPCLRQKVWIGSRSGLWSSSVEESMWTVFVVVCCFLFSSGFCVCFLSVFLMRNFQKFILLQLRVLPRLLCSTTHYFKFNSLASGTSLPTSNSASLKSNPGFSFWNRASIIRLLSISIFS